MLSTGEKTLDLMDLLSMLKESLVSLVPFYWFTFALDVSTVYASTGHFIENTQEADTTRRQVIAVVVTSGSGEVVLAVITLCLVPYATSWLS